MSSNTLPEATDVPEASVPVIGDWHGGRVPVRIECKGRLESVESKCGEVFGRCSCYLVGVE